jgi:hypothetical protein
MAPSESNGSTHQTPDEVAANLMFLEAEKLNELQQVFEPKALPGSVDAAAIVLKIMEQRALLLGMRGPIQVQPCGQRGAPLLGPGFEHLLEVLTRWAQAIVDARESGFGFSPDHE